MEHPKHLRKLSADLEASAERYLEDGDAEVAWFLRGQADRMISRRDARAWSDPLYGADYREGWNTPYRVVR